MKLADRVRERYRRWFQYWLEKRVPEESRVTLDRRRIFIFPSHAGLGYLLAMALVWLIATNFENNIAFAAAALMAALFVVAIHHSYSNLSGLELSIARIEPTFAGNDARVILRVGQSGSSRLRDDLLLAFAGGRPVRIALVDDEMTLELFARAPHRGYFSPGRLTLISHYPLGLFRVWCHVLPAGRGLVYPRPVAGRPTATPSSSAGENPLLLAAGIEDFVGLSVYRPGEPLNHIAWKHHAQGRGLYSKRYGDPVGDLHWVDWEAFPGMDRESRLSRLCQWVLDLSADDIPFGLRIPGTTLAPAIGPLHRDAALTALALFEWQPS
ncbi:MAG: DUF58 domain-containing protein [Porticoccaceae bacterium]|nr:DUF58 domain-containing protein [Porticoccaceae bacterium]